MTQTISKPSADDIARAIALRHPEQDPDTIQAKARECAKLISDMHDGDVLFCYTTKDKPRRWARGTLCLWMFDVEYPKTQAACDGLIRYYDLGAKQPGWRSFDAINLLTSKPSTI